MRKPDTLNAVVIDKIHIEFDAKDQMIPRKTWYKIVFLSPKKTKEVSRLIRRMHALDEKTIKTKGRIKTILTRILDKSHEHSGRAFDLDSLEHDLMLCRYNAAMLKNAAPSDIRRLASAFKEVADNLEMMETLGKKRDRIADGEERMDKIAHPRWNLGQVLSEKAVKSSYQ